jgi:hypothetical protein
MLLLVQNLYRETNRQTQAAQEHTYIYTWPWRCHKPVHLIKLRKQAANKKYSPYRNIASALSATYFIGATNEGYETFTFFLFTYPSA